MRQRRQHPQAQPTQHSADYGVLGFPPLLVVPNSRHNLLLHLLVLDGEAQLDERRQDGAAQGQEAKRPADVAAHSLRLIL